jgi:hypothetical protein
MVDFTAEKDPDDVDVFTLDWTKVLDSGETITDHTVTAPDGLTLAASEVSGAQVRAKLSGGTAGQKYVVAYRIVTSAGRQLDESARITVKAR